MDYSLTSDINTVATEDMSNGTSSEHAQTDSMFAIPVIVIVSLLGVATAIGNLLILIPICRPRNHDSLWTPTNFLIGNLAFLDFLVGAIGCPPLILQLYGVPHNFRACLFIYCAGVSVSAVSIMSYATIATERLIAIKYPFYKVRVLPMRNVILATILCWVIGLVYGYIPLYGWNQGWNSEKFCAFYKVMELDYVVFITHFLGQLPSLLIILFAYVNIYVIAKRHARQITDVTVPAPDVSQPFASTDMRLAGKCFIIIIVYFICHFPMMVINIVDLFFGRPCVVCQIIMVWLIILNSTINPLLYANSNKDLRTAVLKEVRTLFRIEQRPAVAAMSLE